MGVSVNSIAESFLTEVTFQRHTGSLRWIICVSLSLVILQDILGHELLITRVTVKLEILLGEISVEILSMVLVDFPLMGPQISFYTESSVTQLTGIILSLAVSENMFLQAVILHHFTTDLASGGHAGKGDFVFQVPVFVEDVL